MNPLTNLKKLREAREMTQVQLAAFSDVGVNTIGKIETSTDHRELSKVEVWTWMKLAIQLGVPVRDIYPKISIHPSLETLGSTTND